VLLNGQPAATATNVFTVAGCPFTIPPGKPQPCVLVRWTMPAARVLILGQPALLQTPPGPGVGAGMCFSPEQLPQGPPVVSAMQPRVIGS
jgi:hypothetical protein